MTDPARSRPNEEAAKLAFLRDPASYPEATRRVEVKETHMSWVFLTERHAYKLKKPVRYDYLDFSSVELRHRFCLEELRLNRRLAPEVYLAVLPLTMAPGGILELGGSGVPVDWLIKMRRLPEARMLDSAIRAETLQRSELPALTGLLDDFYRAAPRVDITPEDYRRMVLERIAGNGTELTRYCPASSARRIQEIVDAQTRYIAAHPGTFDRRVRDGDIVEGHGDLRPEHVFLGPPPQVIDCLEFERAFRIVDIADDLASLAVECDRLGALEVGRILFAMPAIDRAPPDLIAFYKSYRAALRAKLAIWHLKDADIADPALWASRAEAYLVLAARECGALA